MKLSIIIPTFNESQVLRDCIASLIAQSVKDFEIIIVDDGSTDGTVDILKGLEKKYKNLHYFTQNHKGAGAARNFGASKSTGQILVFVDADMTFDLKFLKNLTAPIINGIVKGTWSREEYVTNWNNVWARCWNINQGWEEKRRHPNNYPDDQPVFRAILKSEFTKVGGYEPGGYTDDWSLYKKLGYKAVNALGAIFYHKNPSTLKEAFLHAMWVGKREYKLGMLGYIVGLLRSSLPVSIIVGAYKSIFKKEPLFLIFKVVYDFGIFIGILEYIFTGKGAK